MTKWASRLTLSRSLRDNRARCILVRKPPPKHSFPMSTCLGSVSLGIFFGGCLAMAVGRPAGSFTARFLGASWLRFFGKYSYCLYICHQPLIILFAKGGLHSTHLTRILGNKFLAIVAVNGIALAASIAVALASWHLFEKHWLKLKDLPFLQHRTAPAARPRLPAGIVSACSSRNGSGM